MLYATRLKNFRRLLPDHTAVVLCTAADIRYLTGFICLNPEEREAFVVVTRQTATLLYPSFSPITKIASIQYHVGYWPDDLKSVLANVVATEHITHVAVDAQALFVSEYQALLDIQPVSVSNFDRTLLSRLRTQKHTSERMAIKHASTITMAAWQYALEILKPGVTELEVAKAIEIKMLQLQADGLAFPPVVAFGPHAALPHHQPTHSKLKQETVVLLDIGAKYQGYCSDMTRTLWFGKTPSKKFVEVEAVVKQAYAAAVEAISPSRATGDIDQAARTVIEQAGYGSNFMHTTGHGLGLEIHEPPSLYFKKPFPLPLHAVITVEPGIYLPGSFGYRYENTVAVTANGYVELTT